MMMDMSTDTLTAGFPDRGPAHSHRQLATYTARAEEQHEFPPGLEASDDLLLAEISQGAEWAMEVFYERYSRYAYTLALRLTSDSMGAEDIVQDAFLAVWRKADSYHGWQGSVRTWLRAIVCHRAIDRLRASWHRKESWMELLEEHEQTLSGEGSEVWEEIWQKEQGALIRLALDQLPCEQRQAIEWIYFAGYTQVEVAERWQVPLGTVKGRIRLGLRKLRLLLAEYGVLG
ncbi:MAG TPA: sigma-70 family RNA polymerase sigma factor [Ktedonosporobacter sp.]|nr:sigma-70 family RNA polymerase sigma factor [Ktedonosporobacter sp.]